MLNVKKRGWIVIGFSFGLLLFTVSRLFFKGWLSDFWLGFWEGISIVLILVGMICIVWSLARGRNPYKFDNRSPEKVRIDAVL